MIDKIVILKSERKLHLIEQSAIRHSFDIDLGKIPIGKKKFKGDKKTPEGKYKIVSKNNHSDYYLSLRISYPSWRDRLYALVRFRNPGGQIMIHGQTTNKNFDSYKKFKTGEYRSGVDWTLGCIATRSNEDMKKVYDLLEVGTEVEICN
jgi:murein L,D-transpeptidase YafK